MDMLTSNTGRCSVFLSEILTVLQEPGARSWSSLTELSNKNKMLAPTVPGYNGNFDDSFYKRRSHRVERSADFGIVWSMGQS